MSLTQNLKFTREEYLKMQKNSEIKHEFFKGEISEITGSSISHTAIVGNTLYQIQKKIIENSTDHKVLFSNIKLHIISNSLFTYPDLLVFKEKIETLSNDEEVVLNPSILIEVSTVESENYELGEKFRRYRDIPSLKEYIIISSTELFVVKYDKQTDDSWLLKEYKSGKEIVPINCLGCEIEMSELYRSVSLNS